MDSGASDRATFKRLWVRLGMATNPSASKWSRIRRSVSPGFWQKIQDHVRFRGGGGVSKPKLAGDLRDPTTQPREVRRSKTTTLNNDDPRFQNFHDPWAFGGNHTVYSANMNLINHLGHVAPLATRCMNNSFRNYAFKRQVSGGGGARTNFEKAKADLALQSRGGKKPTFAQVMRRLQSQYKKQDNAAPGSTASAAKCEKKVVTRYFYSVPNGKSLYIPSHSVIAGLYLFKKSKASDAGVWIDMEHARYFRDFLRRTWGVADLNYIAGTDYVPGALNADSSTASLIGSDQSPKYIQQFSFRWPMEDTSDDRGFLAALAHKERYARELENYDFMRQQTGQTEESVEDTPRTIMDERASRGATNRWRAVDQRKLKEAKGARQLLQELVDKEYISMDVRQNGDDVDDQTLTYQYSFKKKKKENDDDDDDNDMVADDMVAVLVVRPRTASRRNMEFDEEDGSTENWTLRPKRDTYAYDPRDDSTDQDNDKKLQAQHPFQRFERGELEGGALQTRYDKVDLSSTDAAETDKIKSSRRTIHSRVQESGNKRARSRERRAVNTSDTHFCEYPEGDRRCFVRYPPGYTGHHVYQKRNQYGQLEITKDEPPVVAVGRGGGVFRARKQPGQTPRQFKRLNAIKGGSGLPADVLLPRIDIEKITRTGVVTALEDHGLRNGEEISIVLDADDRTVISRKGTVSVRDSTSFTFNDSDFSEVESVYLDSGRNYVEPRRLAGHSSFIYRASAPEDGTACAQYEFYRESCKEPIFNRHHTNTIGNTDIEAAFYGWCNNLYGWLAWDQMQVVNGSKLTHKDSKWYGDVTTQLKSIFQGGGNKIVDDKGNGVRALRINKLITMNDLFGDTSPYTTKYLVIRRKIIAKDVITQIPQSLNIKSTQSLRVKKTKENRRSEKKRRRRSRLSTYKEQQEQSPQEQSLQEQSPGDEALAALIEEGTTFDDYDGDVYST